MREDARYALVGLFVLTLGTALIGLLLWLGLSSRGPDYAYYVATFGESVSGLDVNSSVKYRGVKVGSVTSIALNRDNPTQVKVVIAVAPETPMRTDTVAELSRQGLTGIGTIELSGGDSGPALVGGSLKAPVPIQAKASLFVRLDTAISNMVEQAKDATTYLVSIAGKMDGLLQTDKFSVVQETLHNVGELSERLASIAKRIDLATAKEDLDAVRETLVNVRELTENLATNANQLSETIVNTNLIAAQAAKVTATLPELTTQMTSTLGSFDITAKAISDTAKSVSELANDTRAEFKSVSREALPEVTGLLVELRKLTQTLNRLSQEIERDPGLLLRGRSKSLGPGE